MLGEACRHRPGLHQSRHLQAQPSVQDSTDVGQQNAQSAGGERKPGAFLGNYQCPRTGFTTSARKAFHLEKKKKKRQEENLSGKTPTYLTVKRKQPNHTPPLHRALLPSGFQASAQTGNTILQGCWGPYLMMQPTKSKRWGGGV